MKASLRHTLSKDQALSYARQIVEMAGDGWRTQVFNNLGWHYNAIPKNKYGYVSFRDPGFAMWCYGPHVVGHGDTPRLAVRDARDKLRAQRDELEQAIAKLDETLRGMK